MGDWAILLDLDQTLVLTSAIEHLRRQRAWSTVYRSFSNTSLPPGTREFIAAARERALLGVVTTSPRPYAERLLRHHDLDVPVLVAYHDVVMRKPHPEPVLSAAAKLGIPVANCVHVGDSENDLQAGLRAGVTSLVMDWSGTLPTSVVRRYAGSIFADWETLLVAIATKMGEPELF